MKRKQPLVQSVEDLQAEGYLVLSTSEAADYRADRYRAAKLETALTELTAWAATFNCFEPNEDGVPVCGGTCIPCSARAALGEAT